MNQRRRASRILQNGRLRLLALAIPFILAPAFGETAFAAERAVLLPAPTVDIRPAGLQKTVLAGGCFWGVQGVFQHVKGVTSAISGYAGGSKDTAIYEAVGPGPRGTPNPSRYVRPAGDQLRPDPADLLLGCA